MLCKELFDCRAFLCQNALLKGEIENCSKLFKIQNVQNTLSKRIAFPFHPLFWSGCLLRFELVRRGKCIIRKKLNVKTSSIPYTKRRHQSCYLKNELTGHAGVTNAKIHLIIILQIEISHSSMTQAGMEVKGLFLSNLISVLANVYKVNSRSTS